MVAAALAEGEELEELEQEVKEQLEKEKVAMHTIEKGV